MTGNFNITILIAPLDWGLGHATRCIPIIQYLLNKGCKVIIATEGSQKILLEKEFPSLEILPLKGYRIRYSKNKRFFSFKIAQQIPKIIFAIIKEHNWLKKVVIEYNIDAVISDNRYGLYNSKIVSIFITHQLHIQAPFKWMRKMIQRSNYSLINKFSECWIPDIETGENIAGRLSHSVLKPKIPVIYLGGISRLVKMADTKPGYDFVVIISGPEPQRTLLEHKILKDVENYGGPAMIVRGLPGKEGTLPSINSITIVNHLPAVDLEVVLNKADFIISRSGYTTVMDILKLKKKSILIPTPGQTEQEYLARHLQQQKWSASFEQKEFNLIAALDFAKSFDYKLPELNMEEYKQVLDSFVATVHSSKLA